MVFITLFVFLVTICFPHLSLLSKLYDHFLLNHAPKMCCHALLGISKFVFLQNIDYISFYCLNDTFACFN